MLLELLLGVARRPQQAPVAPCMPSVLPLNHAREGGTAQGTLLWSCLAKRLRWAAVNALHSLREDPLQH